MNLPQEQSRVAKGSDRRGLIRSALGVFGWIVLTSIFWWFASSFAITRVVEFVLKAEPGTVWELAWVRASNGTSNGVWIEMEDLSELRVFRQLPTYRLGGVTLGSERLTGPVAVERPTCGVRVFGIPLGSTPILVTASEGGFVLGVNTTLTFREHAIGLGVIGSVLAVLLVVPGAIAGQWRRGLSQRVTPDAIGWALVVGAQGWMLAWSPVLYCPDSMGYLAGAIRVLREGTLAGFEGPRVPGFGVVLAALWVLPGDFGRWVAVAHVGFGLATAYAAWRMTQVCVSRGAGCVALVLVGCSPLLLGWQRFVMSETLSAFMVTLAAWLAVRKGPDVGFGRAAMGAVTVGLVCAAGAYMRGNLQLLVLAVPLLLACASWKRWGVAGAPALGAIVLAVGVACLLPWTMSNLQKYGEAKLVVGEGYQRNLTTQMTDLMEDNQSGVLSLDEWRALAKGRREGTIDAYSAHDVWLKSDRLHVPSNLKSWGERSAKLDVPAMESIARSPGRAARVAVLGTLNVLGLWRTEQLGFAENEFWSRPLRGVRPGTVEGEGRATNMWSGREIVEGMSSLSVADQEQLWTRTNRDIARKIESGSARMFGRWWNVEDTIRPIVSALFLVGGLAALVRRDWVVVVLAALVCANAAGLAVFTLSGIDRYGVPFEPLLRVVAVYGVWRGWGAFSARRARGPTPISAAAGRS